MSTSKTKIVKDLIAKLDVTERSVVVFHESLKDQVLRLSAAGAFKGMPLCPVLFVTDMGQAQVVENADAVPLAPKAPIKLEVVEQEKPPVNGEAPKRLLAYTMVKKAAPAGTYPGLYVMRILEIEGDRVAAVHDEIEDLSGVVVGRIMGEIERLTQ